MNIEINPDMATKPHCPCCAEKDGEMTAALIGQEHRLGSEIETLERKLAEAKGVLTLSQDEYVKQVGTWKIIQRIEEDRDHWKAEAERLREALEQVYNSCACDDPESCFDIAEDALGKGAE